MTFRKPLPEGCPPDEADEITQSRIVFLLVETNPPTDDDFRSKREKNPGRKFPDPFKECQAHGLSVYLDIRNADNTRARYPQMSDLSICRVELDRGAGFIQQTGTRGHHTWWTLARFDILANSTVVQP